MALVKKFKVLLLSGELDSALQVFSKEAGYEVEVCTEPLSEAQLAKKVEEFQVIALSDRNKDVLTDEVLRSAHRLLAIGCFCEDASAVDVKTASEMGIPVFTSPYGDSHSRAELVISLTVLLARQLGDRNAEMHTGNWQKKSDNCMEVRGKKLGIIGYGHVGSQLGVLAEFLGMKVVWFDHQALMPIGNSEPLDTMEDVLRTADYVSLHLPEMPENVNLISAPQLAMMKKGSYLINTSFGEAINVKDLAAALKSGQLRGAAIDSLPIAYLPEEGQQGLRADFPLNGIPNVILTPGVGGLTEDARRRIGMEVATYLDRYLKDGCTQGSINFPVIEVRTVKANNRRILNIHKNIRGVVTEINHILSNYNINKQIIDTREGMGYCIIDVDTKEVSTDIVANLALLSNSIRTRCV